MSGKRVVIGMSGGVDSSVAAALLKEQGYDVIGVTLALLPKDCESERLDACCGIQAIDDARKVCEQIGIRFQTFNFRDHFRERIIDYFCAEYNAGRTPNPCVRCNKLIKFPSLLYVADMLDGEYIATGHMARIEKDGDRCIILKSPDRQKDQSYFLFELDQETLRRTVFPLSGMIKEDTRRMATELGLHVHEKPESQEICFVKSDRYEDFLREWAPEDLVPGAILNTSGEHLGTHKGVQLYTIGQRKGLGIANKTPLYVLSLDAGANTITVGDNDELFANGLIADNLSWQSGSPPEDAFTAEVKIRYNHSGVQSRITLMGQNRAEILFSGPQRAVAPGQAAVFYDGDALIGGGWIVEPINRNQ